MSTTDDTLSEPPIDERPVIVTAMVGLAISVVSFIISFFAPSPEHYADTTWDVPRAVVTAIGLIVAGSAVSMRPGFPVAWACLGISALAAYGLPLGNYSSNFGSSTGQWRSSLPNSWDSMQMFCGVFGVACLVGAIGAAIREHRKVIYTGCILCMLYHLLGMLSAITSPPPTPWISSQYWTRIGRPYLQFAYMNNAYQFYSPDPGPACEIWACIIYGDGKSEPSAMPGGEEIPGLTVEKPKSYRWVRYPTREGDFQDPLGLTYYRGLAITEQIAQNASANHVFNPLEMKQIEQRRLTAGSSIPLHPSMTSQIQYRPPTEWVQRQILPAYARFLARQFAVPGRPVTSVKIYRLTHIFTEIQYFKGQYNPNTERFDRTPPNDPTQYLPHFMGEYRPNGDIIDSKDPLLYFLLPILPKTIPANDHRRMDTPLFSDYYQDPISEHSGCPIPWGEMEKSK